MKRFGYYTLILTLAVSIGSCDNNRVTIDQKTSSYNPRLHLRVVADNEKLPAGVRKLLDQNSFKKNLKFPLSYYLIPDSDTKFLYINHFSILIIDQLYSGVSGERYYKLFVHPDSDALYAFLKHGYRYIGPDETEFVASPISGNKTVVVWTRKNLSKTPFIVKTNLDEESIQEIRSRLPASSVIETPAMASLIFKRKIKNSSQTIQGQQITELPHF
jgi:hypothetical protein